MASVTGQQRDGGRVRPVCEHVVHVRLDGDTLSVLDDHARSLGLTRSAYLRSRIGGDGDATRRDIRVRCSEVDECAAELRSANSNLHQIENHVRLTSGFYDASKELAMVSRALESVGSKLSQVASAQGAEYHPGMSGPSPNFDGEVLFP